MADLEKRAGVAPARTADVQADIESLPALFGRLGDDVMQLLDTKISLLKVEVKEDADAYIRGGVLIGIGGVIAAVGFALLNVAIAFGVSTLFANTSLSQPAKYALGFVITGVVYLVIGAIIVVVMKNRLAKHNAVPNRTVEELRKDKQWLTK
ncbi:MAG: putative Actinobacterial Holin-X, holin superfamily [Blastocatellia bacterium]|jgi:uncharacterized membrane protein YqjE|nr:putative Actinobacterial Holin-X, holin superfamily [Blastocatellia bacterium]